MSNIWSMIASFIEGIANIGAGVASVGINYEPEIPEELRK